MNILFLKGFNNYFNRIVKKYSTLADYKSNSTSFLEFTSINFNPNDGITTELIVGNKNQQVWTFNGGTQAIGTPLDWENDGAPDYAVCYEMQGNPLALVIKHRWFIMEAQRTRNGQYRLAFKRDVIADHLNQILTAPCFVEKGNINNNGDPLLFNNEQMSMNQIKQSEMLLKDNTGCGWIIGYVSQDKTRYPDSGYYESTSPVATVENYTDLPQVVKDLITLGNFQAPVVRENTSWGVAAGRCSIQAVNWKCASTPKYQGIGWTNVPWAGEASAGWQAPKYDNPLWSSNIVLNGVGFSLSAGNTVPVAAATFAQAIRYNATLRAYYINNILTNGYDLSVTNYNKLLEWDGKFIEKDGAVYKLRFNESSRQAGAPWNISSSNTTYYNAFITEWNSFKASHANENFFTDGNNSILTSNVSIATNGTVQLTWEITNISVVLEPTTADSGYIVKTYIPANRLQACDTPMDIFAIPFGDNFKVYTSVDAETGDPEDFFTISKQVALQAAISMAQAGSNVYDIQVLPYFPDLSKEGTSESDIYIGLIYNNMWVAPSSDFTEDKDYNFIYNDNDAKVGVVFWCRTSTFSVDINKQLSLDNTNPLTLKTSNDCDLFRLTSPNYAGSFEFNLAKSGGRVDKFNADCTYKPYNPYIHVTPYLSGLYGENFSVIDDARGLICGGDFSITKIVDQWQQYELQNKNYQAIFDRQIQNMDVNNQIALEKANFQGITGIFSGILGGGMGGALAGSKAGPYGAIAGAVGGTAMGTLFSELGYVKDMDWLQRSQAETKSYAQDMYGYQLGNIKALPNALAKTSALTNNNKIFPFVEYFTCTDQERDAFKDKVKYNGMTIMKIGTLGAYSTSSDFDRVYVKGQLIRLDDIADDFHVADAIYQEVYKGFFIPQ